MGYCIKRSLCLATRVTVAFLEGHSVVFRDIAWEAWRGILEAFGMVFS